MTDYVISNADTPMARTGAIKLHGPEAFAGMRAAGRLAAETLDLIVPHMVPGVSTGEINAMMQRFIADRGGIPATLGYRGYTHASCISINHVVCHGIPGEKTLRNGDIVNVDVTPILDGWHGDSSRMYLIGDVGVKARRRSATRGTSRSSESARSLWIVRSGNESSTTQPTPSRDGSSSS